MQDVDRRPSDRATTTDRASGTATAGPVQPSAVGGVDGPPRASRSGAVDDTLGVVLARAVTRRALQRFPYADLKKSTKPANVAIVAKLRALVKAAPAAIAGDAAAPPAIVDDAAADLVLAELAKQCSNNQQLTDLLAAVPNAPRLGRLLGWMDNGQDSGTDLLKLLTWTDGLTLGKLRLMHSKAMASTCLGRKRTFWLGEKSDEVPEEAVTVAEGEREKLKGDEFRLDGAKYKGMTMFDNDGSRMSTMVLPTRELGKHASLTYEELDIYPWKPGKDRGSKRIVLSSNGKRYYTSDHYVSFVAF